MAPPRAALALLSAAAAALLAPRAAAFTPGNLLLSLVGDGTAAGAADGALATAHVVLTFEEFAAANGTTRASTGQTATVPSALAQAEGEPPFTTMGNTADPGGSNLSPSSGAMTPSDDGYYLTFVGYTCAAGTNIGSSTTGSFDVQTADTAAQVSKLCTRLIAYIDYSGLVRVVDGDLNSITIFTYPASRTYFRIFLPPAAHPELTRALTPSPSAPRAENYAQNVWSAVYCSSCKGFYVTTGPILVDSTTGGIWFVPSPSIAGTLGLGVKIASTPQTLTNKNYDAYTTGAIFSGVYYVARSASGTCGGIASTGPNPVVLPLVNPPLPVNISQVPLACMYPSQNLPHRPEPHANSTSLLTRRQTRACPP